MRRRRRVAIEFGMCRAGRIGGVSGFMIVGNGRFLEARGGTWASGGNRLPFGDQESVGRRGQGRVVIDAAPAAPPVLTQPQLLLPFLAIPSTARKPVVQGKSV